MYLKIDEVAFKNKVLDLRKRLNQMKLSGNLDENFEKDLEELLEVEKILLNNLVPYYRANESRNRTKIKIRDLEELGSNKFDDFIENLLRVNEDIYMISSTNKKVQWLCYNGLVIEWSKPIKEIDESIIYMEKLGENEIILFALDKIYILSAGSFYSIESIELDYKVELINLDKGIELNQVIRVEDDLFLAYDGEYLFLIKLERDKDGLKIKILKDKKIGIVSLLGLEKISSSRFFLVLEDGYVSTIDYEKEELRLGEKLKIINSQIRKIVGLENEDGKVLNYGVLGNDGELAIVSSKKLKIIKKIAGLNGNLFDIKSKNGLGIILSEDGILYLLEENFKDWNLNKLVKADKVDFINVLNYKDLEYLLVDIDASISSLKIDRIMSGEDLWNLSIYN